jgi:hypothetical protein
MTRQRVLGGTTGAVVAVVGALVALGCGEGSDGEGSGGTTGRAGDDGLADGGSNNEAGKATGGSGHAGGNVSESGGSSSSAGGTAPAGGSSATASDVGAVGTVCTKPGALSCAGTAQRVVTVCASDGLWDAIDTCAADEVCDSRPGDTHATCQVPTPECDGQAASYRFCDEAVVLECDPDGIAQEVETCAERCRNGACVEAAEPDPCPTGEDWVNCADDCGGRTHCQWDGRGVGVYRGAPVLVRTLSPASGLVYPCRGSAGEVLQRWLIPVSVGEGVYRITVDSPWWGADASSGCAGAPTGSCYVVVSSTTFIWIVTDDPEAVSRNALIEEVPEGTECP